MSTKNQKKSVKKLISLVGITGASVFAGLPVLAHTDSSSSRFDNPPINHTQSVESLGRSGLLLAQGASGSGGTGAGQSGTGTGQPGTGTGTGQPGTGTGQSGTGTGTGQPGTGTGQSGTGTGQSGTGGTGASGTTTGQPGASGTGTGQINSQQGTFEEYMRAGYSATQQRDYPTALAYFQRALQLRPGNSYATQAIRNVQGYIQRGTTTTPTNQSNR